jgi:MFS family permease
MVNQHRAYRALQAEFFLLSVQIMLWTPRIPMVKDALGLNNGQLGRVLMFGGVAGLFFSRPIGSLVVRHGSKRVGGAALPLALVGYSTIGLARTEVQLALGLVVAGVGLMAYFTAITTQAGTHNELTGRNTLNNLTAVANIGTLSCVAVGSALLGAMSNAQYIVGGSIATLSAMALFHAALLAEDHKEDHEGTGGKLPWLGRAVLPLYIVAAALMASTVSEFSTNDWSALYTRDVLGIGAPWYTAPFLAFQVAMVTARFRADALGARFGVARYVLVGAVMCALGWTVLLVAAQHAPSRSAALILTLAAFAFAGAGIGPIYPAYMDAVALQGFDRPVVLARLFSIVTAALVFGPGIIGAVAQAVGLRCAMLLPPVMLVVAATVGNRQLVQRHATALAA